MGKPMKVTPTVECFVGGQIRRPGEEFEYTGDPNLLPKHVIGSPHAKKAARAKKVSGEGTGGGQGATTGGEGTGGEE